MKYLCNIFTLCSSQIGSFKGSFTKSYLTCFAYKNYVKSTVFCCLSVFLLFYMPSSLQKCIQNSVKYPDEAFRKIVGPIQFKSSSFSIQRNALNRQTSLRSLSNFHAVWRKFASVKPLRKFLNISGMAIKLLHGKFM